MLNWVEHEKSFITSGLDFVLCRNTTNQLSDYYGKEMQQKADKKSYDSFAIPTTPAYPSASFSLLHKHISRYKLWLKALPAPIYPPPPPGSFPMIDIRSHTYSIV